MPSLSELIPLFEDLTGQKVEGDGRDLVIFEDCEQLGYSQFNEVLSLLELNRVSKSFFQYLVNGESEYQPGSAIANVHTLEQAIEKFMVKALFLYGNVKFAFNHLSYDFDALEEMINDTLPEDPKIYELRHKPIKKIKRIPKEKTYLLGYLSQIIIDEALSTNPSDQKYLALSDDRKKYIEYGKENQEIYLTYDHLDVYVATSMRLEHEFLNVDENVTQIFQHKAVKKLKLRYFNPTQAYTPGRIEKGLSEALMLKRAKCTIYFVQENDTLGKDSELASTLAQGKPVIAFIPIGDKRYVDELLKSLEKINPEKLLVEIILEQLMIFAPNLPWQENNSKLREWINNPKSADEKKLRTMLYEQVQNHYNKRANVLKSDHPLGIQVNLKSGVANGVLVVRTIENCAKLLKRIVLNEMKYKLIREKVGGVEHLHLKESISESIFRLQTGDRLLTNSFWNFYLNEEN